MSATFQAIFGSAVLAALIASIVTSSLQSWLQSRRDAGQRRRIATGMLQRAQGAATMLLQAIESVEHNIETDTSTALESLTGIMLSAEFTTATADLDLEDAYRELERLHSVERLLPGAHAELLRLRKHEGRDEFLYFTDGGMVPNPEYDPAIEQIYEGTQRRYTGLVNMMRNYGASLRQTIRDRQATLASKLKK